MLHMRYKQLFKDPLAHFIVAGVLIFVLLSLVRPPQQNDQIIVDRRGLLSFIQYRSKAFEPARANAILDQMAVEERERLIHDYIREEALYREALKLGLDDNDYVIRQRLVQKLEFISDTSGTSPAPEPTELAVHYEAHQQDYFQAPTTTFSHVFISFKGRSRAHVMHEAQTLLETLTTKNAGFEDATAYGERFLFHTNYVERRFDDIKSDFGSEATEIIFSEDSPLSEWFGPVESRYGVHLIFIKTRRSGRVPPLDEIESLVMEDMKRVNRYEQKNALINTIIEQYSPVIKADIDKPLQTQTPVK